MSSHRLWLCLECGVGLNPRTPTPWLCTKFCQHAREARMALGEEQWAQCRVQKRTRKGHFVSFNQRLWQVENVIVVPGFKDTPTVWDLRMRLANFDPNKVPVHGTFPVHGRFPF